MLPRLAFLLAVTALAVFYHYFFGVGPTPSEYIEDLEWWRPWGTATHWLPLASLATLAQGPMPRALLAIGLVSLPPVALCVAGMRLLRSAFARSYLLFLTLMMLAFVYYGYRAGQVWRFFEWRFVAVCASFAAVVSVLLFAPSLFESLWRRSRALAGLGALLVLAAIFLLSTEVTGTNSRMPFNVSPWPIVTLFGFLLAGGLIAATHAGSGAALWLRARLKGIGGYLAGAVVAWVVGFAAGTAVFTEPAGRGLTALIALVCAVVWMFAERRDPNVGHKGFFRLATGAVLLLALIGSSRVGGVMQRHARDVRALQVLDALEAYKKAEGTYPEKLEELVPKYLAEVPRPGIGLLGNEDDRFSYSNYGDSYALEFASVLWVQCQYSPPYEFASGEAGEDDSEAASDKAAPPEAFEKYADVAAAKPPTAEELAAKATLAQHGLNGSWSCPEEPPKLW
jgi:hypothetical protein